MTLDPAVVPGLLLLAAEIVALAAVGVVVARVALRQTDEVMALAQGLVVGPALWGLAVSLVLHLVPGLAGALVGWGVTLGLGAVLAWRAPRAARPSPRIVAGFVIAILAVFWVALASRQTMSLPDPFQHLGVGAAVRAGIYPPEISWSPGIPLHYHYGLEVLVGLLAPPTGPDVAFVSEVLGAYFWTALAAIMVTALHRRGGWFAVVAVAPLLISTGAWTWHGMRSVVTATPPVPTELTSAGLASLGEAYWPTPPTSLRLPVGALPDIWLPAFTLAYALGLVVIERALAARDGPWFVRLSLAALVGFLGLVQSTVVPIVLALWAGIEAIDLIRLRRAGGHVGRMAVQAGGALAVAVVLILVNGGAFARVLDGHASAGLVIAPRALDEVGIAFGQLSRGANGSGLLAGIGPLVVAGVAAALGRRDRLIVVLALGAGMFTLAWTLLDYLPAPWDLNRLAGHSRYFALAALVLALGGGLARLQPRRRYAAGALLALLLVWPTIASPARILGMTLANGVEVANAARVPDDAASPASGNERLRYAMPDVSPAVAEYVRHRTPPDARVFTAGRHAWDMTVHTGRSSASGFVGLSHITHYAGPEHLDVLHYLEPAAIRRMGIEYVHATDAWVAALPPRARAWIADSRLFEPVVRDGGQALYRVRPAFLDLDVAPDPASFEALRQAVPPSASVYLVTPPREYATLLVGAALSHARLLGELDPLFLHVIPPAKWHADSLTDQTPDVVVLPTGMTPWMFRPTDRFPIWWNDDVAVYSPTGGVPPILEGPGPTDPALVDAPPIRMDVADIKATAGRIEFTAAFREGGSQPWTGQDWIVIAGDRSPWAIPTEVFRHGQEPVIAQWIQGLLSPVGVTTSHTYRFDASEPALSVRNDSGEFVPLPASDAKLGAGGYTLALRLRHEYQPNRWRDAAVIPVLRVRVSGDEMITYEPFDDVLGDQSGSGSVTRSG